MVNRKMDERYVDEMLRMGAEFFSQFNDPTEIASTRGNYDKIIALHPSTYKLRTNEDGQLIAWTVVIPTSRLLAEDFIERRITEKELLEKTDKNEVHDALYLFAALALPEYRGRGYIKEMLGGQINEISGDKKGKMMLFAWPVTVEGGKMVDALSRDLGVAIARRKKKEDIIGGK